MHIPSLLLIGFREFDLDTINAIDAIDEENQDENKRYLHPILQFCYQWTLASV